MGQGARGPRQFLSHTRLFWKGVRMGQKKTTDRRLGKFTKDSLVALSESFELFLRAGGHITYTEWNDIPPEARGALVAAGDRLAVEKAVQYGVASLSPDSAAELLAPYDGGAMKVSLALERANREIIARLKKHAIEKAPKKGRLL